MNGSAPMVRNLTDGKTGEMRIALCGDVMTGRGIDQILPHPGRPELHERYIGSALDYVALAEQASGGEISRHVPSSYLWGDAIDALQRFQPDALVVNLETAVTTADRPELKGINYRMHPANIDCLASLGVDCCVLANNHVLDWGEGGLAETLNVCRQAGIRTAGAGRSRAEAAAPAELSLPDKGRILIFAAALPSSGTLPGYAATSRRPGVMFLEDLSPGRAGEVSEWIGHFRRPDDLVILSLHWGPNWGYDVSEAEMAFAHALAGLGVVDVVHGHSSHHPRAVEIWRSKPILYGCGDFLNDYEGIRGYETYRGDLVLLYLVTMAGPPWGVAALEMVPFRIRKFRLQKAAPEEAEWLRQLMDRECGAFGGRVSLENEVLRLVLPPVGETAGRI